MKKCILLFNGGIDSVCAALVLQQLKQFEILLLHFTSPFYGNHQQRLKETARSLKLPILCVSLAQTQQQITCNPKYGYGSQANPCVDCRSNMLRHAYIIMKQLKYDFLATGDALDQHPTSQSMKSILKIDKITQIPDIVLRLLSQKLLPDNQLISSKVVDKNMLLGVCGKMHKVQEQIMKQNRVNFKTDYQGCRLLYAQFSKKLMLLKQDGLIHSKLIMLSEFIKIGRPARFQSKQVCIIFKGSTEMRQLEQYLAAYQLSIEQFEQQFCYVAKVEYQQEQKKKLDCLIMAFDFRNIEELQQQEQQKVQQFPDLEDQFEQQRLSQAKTQGYVVARYHSVDDAICGIDSLKQRMGQLNEAFVDFIMKLSLYCSKNCDISVNFNGSSVQVGAIDASTYSKDVLQVMEAKLGV